MSSDKIKFEADGGYIPPGNSSTPEYEEPEGEMVVYQQMVNDLMGRHTIVEQIGNDLDKLCHDGPSMEEADYLTKALSSAAYGLGFEDYLNPIKMADITYARESIKSIADGLIAGVIAAAKKIAEILANFITNIFDESSRLTHRLTGLNEKAKKMFDGAVTITVPGRLVAPLVVDHTDIASIESKGLALGRDLNKIANNASITVGKLDQLSVELLDISTAFKAGRYDRGTLDRFNDRAGNLVMEIASHDVTTVVDTHDRDGIEVLSIQQDQSVMESLGAAKIKVTANSNRDVQQLVAIGARIVSHSDSLKKIKSSSSNFTDAINVISKNENMGDVDGFKGTMQNVLQVSGYITHRIRRLFGTVRSICVVADMAMSK